MDSEINSRRAPYSTAFRAKRGKECRRRARWIANALEGIESGGAASAFKDEKE
jgi:hypothetical protein